MEKKIKKILMYIDTMARGGAQRVMINLADYFVGESIEVVLINDYRLKDKEIQYQIDTRIKRYYLRESLEGNVILKNIERIINLRNIVKQEKPDVVLSFLGRPNKRMLLATIGLKTKKIVSVRNDPYKEYGTIFFKKQLARSLFKLADGCVFQTNDAKKYFPSSVQGKSVVIPNPVGAEFYSTVRSEEPEEIISIGRIELQKNNELLIRAFKELEKKYPNERLVFYGTGSQQKRLEILVRELKLDGRVFFAGDTDQVPEKLRNCKLFVLSSDYEGMPNALMEAMAVGVPCISTDCPCGGPKELIQHMTNGILVPVKDKEKLRDAIDMLLGDPLKRNQIGARAMERAKLFRNEKIYESWMKYFHKVLNN